MRANSKEFEDLLDWDAQRHGVEWVKAAMTEAADANHDRYGVKPKLLFAILDAKTKPKQKIQPKGSVKIASSPNFKPPPAETGNEPWASF